MKKINPILLFTTLVLVTISARAASLYVVTDLGMDTSAVGIRPVGINSYGQISGEAGPSAHPLPFLWTPTSPNATTGTFVDLQPPTGVGGGGPINDYGEIVAGGSFQSNTAQLWKPTVPNGSVGAWTPLTGLQVVSAINSSGQVAGYSTNFAFYHMLLWSPTSPNGTSGSTVDLGDVPGHSQLSGGAIGYDINSQGQISGIGNQTNNLHGWAVLWSPNTPNGATGSMIGLTNFTSYCGPINNMGQVVVENESNNFHLLLWTPTAPNATTGTLTDIGHFSGSFLNYPYAINSTGSIAGYAQMTDNTFRAFLWEPNVANGSSGTLYDLNTLLSPADAFNWTLQYAWDMNDRGQIVGNASYDPDGPGPAAAILHGVLLTPVPEPATSVLFICGFIPFALMCERRKRPR
jgi:probable HAF family extracellular repeat protein